MIGGLLRDAWAWLTLDPERVWVCFVAGAIAQLLVHQTLRLLILGRRE